MKIGSITYKPLIACITTLFVYSHVQAVPLAGTLTVSQGQGIYNNDDEFWETYLGGSYFNMDGHLSPGDMPGPTFNPLSPGSGPGLVLGSYQNFVTSPDVPHPQGWQGNGGGAAGAGYAQSPTQTSDVLSPFIFFGKPVYTGTNPVSYQSGLANPLPTADYSNCNNNVCTLTVDLQSWAAMWNGNVFDQGPRPSNTGPFTLATGTIDFNDNTYSLTWESQILGGPFNNVIGFWHFEGTYIAAVPEPSSYAMLLAGLGLVGWAARKRVKTGFNQPQR